MLFFYLDESGTGLGDKRTPFFLLSCLSIPAEYWRFLDNELQTLKRRLFPWAEPEDFEIKGRDMRRGEKFFNGLDWNTRSSAILEVADLISRLPCHLFVVRVDKRLLTEYIRSDEQLYRLAFTRLLEGVDSHLQARNETGMLMIDARSDLHSSVQDRRLVDAYRDWRNSRQGKTQLVEIPWFGFSAFYVGLQLADFSAYTIDFAFNEVGSRRENDVIRTAYQRILPKLDLWTIP